jgi:hypothetical protein
MADDKIPEGASKTFRVDVPDGRGGYKDLAGYTFTGILRSATGGPALATIAGALDPTDSRFGLVPLSPAHTTGLGRAAPYKLDLEASNGASVHVRVIDLRITDR